VALLAFTLFTLLGFTVRTGSWDTTRYDRTHDPDDVVVNLESGPWTRLDMDVWRSCIQSQEKKPRLTEFLYEFTKLCEFRNVCLELVPFGLILLFRRHFLLAFTWGASLGAGLLSWRVLKTVFDLERPPSVPRPYWSSSFPSGHTMAATLGYGFLAYLCLRLLPAGWLRRSCFTVVVLLIILMGFTRVYLGQHFVSDVLAGYAVGGGWLALCIGCAESLRRHKDLARWF
jgi:undecaprenyl-diphosphatase